MSKANGTGVTKLFEDAHAEGILSPAGLQTLTVVGRRGGLWHRPLAQRPGGSPRSPLWGAVH